MKSLIYSTIFSLGLYTSAIAECPPCPCDEVKENYCAPGNGSYLGILQPRNDLLPGYGMSFMPTWEVPYPQVEEPEDKGLFDKLKDFIEDIFEPESNELPEEKTEILYFDTKIEEKIEEECPPCDCIIS